MNYKESDFDKCIINPFQKGLLSKNRIFKDFVPEPVQPEGEEEPVKEFSVEEIENVIRYIIMIHDPQSPLVRKENDLNRRKMLAAIESGLNGSEEYMKSIYTCVHPLVVPLTVGYLQKFTKSKEWAAIVAFEEAFWECIRKLSDPFETIEKKSKMKEEVATDIDRLDLFYKKFYADDIQLEAKVGQRISPESMSNL